MKTKNYSPDSGTIARTIILMLALANQVLTTLITWWKNNSFTKTAKVGDEAMKKAKARKFNQNK